MYRIVFFQILVLLVSPSTFGQNDLKVKTLVKDFYGNGCITVANNGEIYVNEYGKPNSDISGSGNRIFKISTSGEVKIISEKVNGPIGGVFGKDGSYYFNNGSSYTESQLMFLADGEYHQVAKLSGFSGDMILDEKESYLLITSYTQPVIYKVGLDGAVSEYIRDERVKGCTGITYGKKGVIFVSNFTTGKIYMIKNDDVLIEFASIPEVYPGYVIGYITFFDGNLYATGYGASKIYRIDMKGRVHEFAGSGERIDLDGEVSEAGFLVPNGIDIDPVRRRLYISQNGNGKPAGLRYIDIP